ncbi:DHA2 family multidrug resistance protein-like MFS transporter [Motilibacter rhizosphaerae]|uniref:DHA2 family multidrug resistance protein-like MFS transporter n=1 Tax=Motilibacter rhizosphaerae TaxID=598652 RepID=A0A4Q7NAX3_9ACTN|nr:MFS transporter [Motilibacter rhizosphaerae]RZS80102.1 DHA2 family multidrug resistance protein-like MFS transporter [Motilibacter rhizosphaerae]
MILAPTLPAAPSRAGRPWLALAVLALPLLLVSMDVSVLYFAVPDIARDLHASATQQLWMLDVYGLVLAGLLLPMGALGDRVGRRRLLLCGAAGFGAASLAAAYAPSAAALVAARAVLGVAGATLMPSTLALVRQLFPDERDRARAIGIWSGVMTGGVALGPVISGVLLEHAWWGSVFLLSLPAMALLLVVGPVLLPESEPRRTPFDVPGAALSLLTVLSAVWAVKRAAADGVGTACLAAALLALTAGAALVQRLRTTRHPLVDPALLRAPAVRGPVLANALAMGALVGNGVLLTAYLQLVLGMSPLRAALWSLAPSLVVGAAAPLATVLAQRVGRRAVVATGLATGAAGFVLLALVGRHDLALLVVGAGVLASGLVAVAAVATEAVVGGVSAAEAGRVTALSETSSELGGALGIALLGSVAAAAYRHGLADRVPAPRPVGGLAGAVVAAAGLPGPRSRVLLEAARDAYVGGVHAASWGGAGALLVGAAGVALSGRAASRPPRAPRP